MTKEDFERLTDRICSSISWVTLWTFFIMLQSCCLANSGYQREMLDELKKQNKILQQCANTPFVKEAKK